jgi:hypothetical protein
MPDDAIQATWYYVGHYGQLGPLTLDQMGELVRDGVIGNDTFVWRQGMPDWAAAADCRELVPFGLIQPSAGPPPVPTLQPAGAGVHPPIMYSPPAPSLRWDSGAPTSDRSRVLGGVLNLIPGVGRIYLGYVAVGVLQAMTTILCGVGLLWAVADAIYILAGGLKHDGYGRKFVE